MTTWKTVPGHDRYEVSEAGQVRSLISNKILKQFKHGKYRAVGLAVGAKQPKHYYVHQLVMMAHISLCPEGMEVCHNDGNHENNHLTNLRYDTRSNNTLDKVAHGTHSNAIKTHCPSGHEFTEINTYIHRGGRSCKTCRRAAHKKWRTSRSLRT